MRWITEILEDNARREQKETIKNLQLNNMNPENEKREFPRRMYLDLHTPAEKAISDAIQAVEEAGADVLLTEAIILLQQAKEKVADYVDDNA